MYRPSAWNTDGSITIVHATWCTNDKKTLKQQHQKTRKKTNEGWLQKRVTRKVCGWNYKAAKREIRMYLCGSVSSDNETVWWTRSSCDSRSELADWLSTRRMVELIAGLNWINIELQRRRRPARPSERARDVTPRPVRCLVAALCSSSSSSHSSVATVVTLGEMQQSALLLQMPMAKKWALAIRGEHFWGLLLESLKTSSDMHLGFLGFFPHVVGDFLSTKCDNPECHQ